MLLFHIMQHANDAIDEVRRAEFFRNGGRLRGLVKGKRWLLLSRWMNLTAGKRQELNQLFALKRKVFRASEGESGAVVGIPASRQSQRRLGALGICPDTTTSANRGSRSP